MKITVVGLGPGPYDLLTREAALILQQAPRVLVRTARHPTLSEFPPSIKWESLDYVYDRHESYENLYQDLAREVMAVASKDGEAIYAVPGDPSVAEDSVRELLRLAKEQDVEVRVAPGVSFVEVTLSAAGVTATGGLQLLDAQHVASANPLLDLLVYQVEDPLVASDVKLELLRRYPADHSIMLVQAAGVPQQQVVRSVPLHDLDRQPGVDHLTAVFVPASMPEQALGSFDSLVRIVARLRAPDGCPWDREQTHATLKPYVVEEAYEVVEAIDGGEPATLSEELGDLLLQVLLHAQVADEAGNFDITDVVAGIGAKMIQRHPHVFGDVAVSSSKEVLANWEALKKKERAAGESMFAGVPVSLPALQAAQRIQERAAHVGFDWKDTRDVLDKVAEEVEELAHARRAPEVEDEFGDVLFALVNAARHLGIDAEMALRGANRKFVQRFLRMEEMARDEGVEFASLELAQQDELWNRAKAEE